MAGLEALTSLIYHERQQPGSMLCAQHALNSLLQGNYFTPPDLAQLARSLDSQERESLNIESYEDASANMDDTGFFSVQVIEKALKVWGLNLVRWRSEQMRPYQTKPHTQLAFVLNHHQHWLTLRRFGPALPIVDLDPGEGHWYNLNSSFDSPQWIGPLFLNMVLQQMETEGYSVFAVCQADPEGPLALPRVDADIVAGTLESPSDSSPASATPNEARPTSFNVDDTHELHGFEDEDMELQAALQASLTGRGYEEMTLPALAPALREAPPPPTFSGPSSESALGLQGVDRTDPVAASLMRNRAIMDQMRREQEAALRESYEGEIAQFGGVLPPPPPGRSGIRERSAAEIEEDEAIQRALSASRAEHGSDDEMDEEYYTPPTTSRPAEPLAGSAGRASGANRVYDDDDAELQAALKASLESVPEGFTIPATPPPRVQPAPVIASSSSAASHDDEDDDDLMSERVSTPPPPEPSVDVDEMRRRRLARFGG